MTFRVGDRIAHPMHGAGVIDSIVTKRINGKDREYYVLKLPAGDMLVMVPVETCDAIGVRPIVAPAEAEAPSRASAPSWLPRRRRPCSGPYPA